MKNKIKIYANDKTSLRQAEPKRFLVPRDHAMNLDFMQNNGLDLYEILDQLEVALILESIKKCRGNYSAAARLLGINRTTFMMKLAKVRNFDAGAIYRHGI